MTATTSLTIRENTLLALAMSGLDNREQALADCRQVFGRALITAKEERANVAAVLASRGMDGLGRVQLALDDLDATAKADQSLLAEVRG
jgi:hypothetical protein